MKEREIEDKEFEEFHKANTFIFKKEYAEAEKALQLGLEKAKREKANDKIAFYLSALGQLYLLQKRRVEALTFFEQADEVFTDYYGKINFARLLSSIYKDHDRAFNKAAEALKLIPPNNQALNGAYSVMGLCCLGKSDQDKALEYFRESLKVDFAEFVSSESFDMTLITELINNGLYDAKMDFYLTTVRKKAVEEDNVRLINVTDELLEKIRKTKE